MTAYPDLPGLEEVLLEDAVIVRSSVREGRVSVVVDAALLGGHPDYQPPSRGELHCRAELLLQVRGSRSVEGALSVGERLRTLEVDGDALTFVGASGRLRVVGGSLRVRHSR